MRPKRRDLVGELLEGVDAMRAHREGKLTLRTHELAAPPLPLVTAALVRDTRERLKMSQGVFARKLRINLMCASYARLQRGLEELAWRPHVALGRVEPHAPAGQNSYGF